MLPIISRRALIKSLGAGAFAFGVGGMAGRARAEEAELPAVKPYELPPLPYAYNALEPQINEATVRVHHDKHHAAYVKGLNTALESLEKARASNDFSHIKCICNDIAFNGSGHVLHTLYWNSMRSGASPKPEGVLMNAIERDFGSFDSFKGQFTAAAKQAQASSWGVLAWEPMGRRLVVLTAGEHQNLTIWGATPLLVCDTWEHAYYLQYQNRRPEYVDAFFQVIDWPAVSKRFEEAVREQAA